MREVFLSAKNLSIGYPKSRTQEKATLHRNFTFELYSGELTCLLGENGTGKSTLLRTITGLQSPIAGEIYLKGKNLNKYSEEELSRLMGLVLTDKTTAGGFTVSELVGLGRYPYTGFFGKLSKKDLAIIEDAMNDVGIGHKANSYVAQLSDGERQKVMIAKALAQECPLIVLDEPTAFLDVVNRIEIMNLLHHLAVDQNKTILLSTHDIELALLLADRLWLLAKDKGLATGVTEDILFSSLINEYIGSSEISFDAETGRFQSRQVSDKIISLAANGKYYNWTKNFLSRNGYLITDNTSTEESLHVFSPERIEYIRYGKTRMFKSFEELYLFFKQ